MINQIDQALSDLKRIEQNLDAITKERNNLRFDNEQLHKENEDLRRLLATSVETIQRLRNEEEESPRV